MTITALPINSIAGEKMQMIVQGTLPIALRTPIAPTIIEEVTLALVHLQIAPHLGVQIFQLLLLIWEEFILKTLRILQLCTSSTITIPEMY